MFTQEERPGLRDGRYLDIAAAVLDALRQNAHDSGNAYLGFDALFIEVKSRQPGVDADDLRYVLNVLSRPTELWAIDRSEDTPRLVSDKATELVEKTFFAEDYRLAAAGRTALAVAANVQSFAYAEGDVLKLLRAIEAGDFTRVPGFCAAILDSVRYESVDLQMIMEKGFVDRQSTIYKDQLPRYRQVIQHSADLLRQADAKLKVWRAPQNDALDDTIEVDLYDLEQHVLQVYQALEAFGRQLSELTSLAAQRRASVVAPPDFLLAALSMVKGPPSASQMTYVFRQFGPISLDGVYPSPLDVAGKVRINLPKTQQVGRYETAGASTIAHDAQLLFISKFGPAIRQRLSAGPLPLSEALANGWCEIEGQPAWSELLGVYVSPWSLGIDQPIRIRIPADLVARSQRAVGDVVVSDLELALQGEKGNQ